MLHVVYGTDRDATLVAHRELLARFKTEHPGISVFSLDDDTLQPEDLGRYIESVGLFNEQHIVLLSDALTSEPHGEDVEARLPQMEASANIFLIREGKLSAKISKACVEHAETCEEFALPKSGGEKAFSIFALTDALGMRDKKNLWLLYQEALAEGSSPEEVHGILAWQMRVMLQASKGATENIKPFVLGKAKRFLKNYTEEELEQKLFELIQIFHDAHRGGLELSLALERFILAL